MNRVAVHALYYTAHTAKSLLWTASDLVTIYALVNLAGVNAGWAGGLFLAGLAVNALADLMVGLWIDRHPPATPWLAGAGLLCAGLAFPLTMLAAPAGTGGLVVATLLFRLGYAAYDVPHNAMLGRLADTPGAASRLSRGRTLGTGVAAALVGWGLRGTPDAQTLALLLWILACAAMAGGTLLLPLLFRARETTGTNPALPVRGEGLPWSFLIGSLLGMVALGALAKAMLHLPGSVAHPDAGLIVILLTAGRTTAALLPLAFGDTRRGRRLLAWLYFIAAPLITMLLWHGGWALPTVLGLLMGATNLIGWALLPLMARGARSFGLYTMASKLALGAAGLAMTAALGPHAQFTPGGAFAFAGGVMIVCIVAGWLLLPRRWLTTRLSHGVEAA